MIPNYNPRQVPACPLDAWLGLVLAMQGSRIQSPKRQWPACPGYWLCDVDRRAVLRDPPDERAHVALVSIAAIMWLPVVHDLPGIEYCYFGLAISYVDD